jgi:hypothetical protein
LNRRVGRDGRVRPADPIAQRRRIAELLGDDLDQPVRPIANLTGASPATVLDVRRRLRESGDPLPARLRSVTDRAGPRTDARRTDWRTDIAVSSEPANQEFLAWIERVRISDADWNRHAGGIPLSRVYELIDEARAQAASWERFAAELAARTRRR